MSIRLTGWLEAVATRGYAGLRWPEDRIKHVHRRTLATLVVSQCTGGLSMSIGIAVASLLAEQLSGSEKLAGLVQTGQVLGTALASYLLAHLMGRHGRRPGLMLGYVLGAVGGVLCVTAGAVGSFAMLLVGAVLLGSTSAANNQSRYAATDLAPPKSRARSLSLVVWATTVGAVAGPNLTGVSGRLAHWLGLPRLTGPFLVGVFGMVVAAVVLGAFLRPDPLLVARQAAVARGAAVRSGTSWSRVAQVVRDRPAVAAGVVTLALSQAVMVAVMVMTPLHMHDGGATLELIGVVISIHVLGMYAFSPVVGWAADRFGRPTVIGVGALVLLVALLFAGTAPAGASYRIGVGLFLLGLGWSCCNVAASTLVSEAAPLASRTDVQGAADLVMGVVAAMAGALAGVVEGTLGFGALAAGSAVLVAGVATAAEYARRTPDGAADPLPL